MPAVQAVYSNNTNYPLGCKQVLMGSIQVDLACFLYQFNSTVTEIQFTEFCSQSQAFCAKGSYMTFMISSGFYNPSFVYNKSTTSLGIATLTPNAMGKYD